MIIGLAGNMQVGKDTVADYLVENYGFVKVGFSDKLYEAVCALFNITLEEALEYKQRNIIVNIQELNPITEHNDFRGSLGEFTWREFLQRFGTEMGRNVFGQAFWTRQLLSSLTPTQNYVVRDVRFNNEALGLLTVPDSYIWQITRPGYEGDAHASEQGINERYIGLKLWNNGTLGHLYEQVNKGMEVLHVRD